MNTSKNTVALYVDKDLVSIHKASLDMYEALKSILNEPDFGIPGKLFVKARDALAKAEGGE